MEDRKEGENYEKRGIKGKRKRRGWKRRGMGEKMRAPAEEGDGRENEGTS